MPTPRELQLQQKEADTIFGELLDWIGQIELLTDTIKRRIDRAIESNDD